ncbi:MAG: EpsG family protein [Lachnospiraceae bacterium]|nr:EpsG family protein [Lachnospiraceae bacterium]
MIPYYILCFVPLLFCLIENEKIITVGQNQKKREIKASGITIFFILFGIMLSLRDIKCGIDLENYNYYFNKYSNLSFRQVLACNGYYDVEVGFRVFDKLFTCVSHNFQLYLAIIAVFSIAPVWWLYKRECIKPVLMLSIFLTIAPFTLYFSSLRQVLAIALAIPAFQFTKKRKLILFILVVILASTIHSSAIIMFAIYPVFWMHITQKWLYVVIPLIVAFFLISRYIFKYFLGFLVGTKYEMYTMSSTGAYGMFFLLILLSAMVFIITGGTGEAELTRDEIGLRNLLLVSVCLQSFASLSTIAMRLNYYYLIFVPITIPRLLSKSSIRFKQIAKAAEIFLTCFFFLHFIVDMYTSADILEVFPFVPFWQNSI